MAGISVGGLTSGIDYDTLVTNLMNIERRPVALLEGKKNNFNTKLKAFQDLNLKLSSFKSAIDKLKIVTNYNVKKASSTDETILTATATSSAVAGNNSIEVLQVAQPNKIASQGYNDINVTPISSSNGNFSFKVGSGSQVDISITTSTTLQQLQEAINNANAGVTATIVNDGSKTNPYRLILTSNSTGSSNNIQIVTNVTNLNFSTKSIEAATYDTGNTFNGTVTSSGTYTGTGSKTYIAQITTAGAIGAAKFKVSNNGGATWSADDAFTTSASATSIYNTTDEGVDIAFAAGTVNFVVGDKFYIDAFDPSVQNAQDAVIKVNGLTLTKSSNSITDAIPGVTMDIKKASIGSPVTLAISKDKDSVKKNIEDFIKTYNDTISFINDKTKYNSQTKTASALTGDSTVRSISRRLKTIISSSVTNLSGTITALSQIGVKTEKDGTLTLDSSKLSTALDNYYDEVAKIFVKEGTTTDADVIFNASTNKTKAGIYSVSISQVPEQATVSGTQAIQSSGITNAETLTFTWQGSPYQVSLAAGDKIDQIVSKINTQLASQNVFISATNNSGSLKLISQEYGSMATFTVTSNQADSSAQTGIGIAGKSDTGVDVIGTINSHTATASGNTLVGATGYDEEGLSVSVYATSTGSQGNVKLTLGVAAQMGIEIDSLTNSADGIIKAVKDGLNSNISSIDRDINRKETILTAREENLRLQFAHLESVLNTAKTQSSFLANQLSRLLY